MLSSPTGPSGPSRSVCQHGLAVCLSALGLGLTLGVAACSDSGGGGDTTPVLPDVALRITSDRVDGGPQTDFDLAIVQTGDAEGVTYEWDFGDAGRTAEGARTTVRYDTPGLYDVSVTARVSEGEIGTTRARLAVLDPAGGNLFSTGIAIPPVLGDVDGDAALSAADVAAIDAHVARTSLLSASTLRAADFNLDGRVDDDDARLVEQTVMAGGTMPSVMKPNFGRRTSVVRLLSPALMDVHDLVQVQVGAGELQPVRRVYPGRGQFVVPVDVSGTSVLEPATPGTVPVAVFVNGLEVERFDYELEADVPVQDDELQLLETVTDELVAAILDVAASFDAELDALGVSEADRAVAGGLLNHAGNELVAAADRLAPAADAMTADQRRALGVLLNGAGLRDLEEQLAARTPIAQAPATASDLGLVRLLCGLGQLSDLARAHDQLLDVAAAATGGAPEFAAIFPVPVEDEVLAELRAAAASAQCAADLVATLSVMQPMPAGGLDATAQLVAGSNPPTYELAFAVRMPPSVGCAEPGRATIDRLLDATASVVVGGLRARIDTDWLESPVFAPDTGALRGSVLDAVQSDVEGLGISLTPTNIADFLEGVRTASCDAVSSGSLQVGADELSDLTFAPIEAGTLSLPQQGSGMPATFVCGDPASGPQTVVFSAGLDICVAPLLGEVSVTCPGEGPALSGFLEIAAGTYRRGSDAFPGSDEQPVHDVTISQRLWVGEHEVTQSEYVAVVGSNPSGFQSPDRPVERVSWDEALAYCAAITQQERAAGRLPVGYEYRLPTEGEWEFACRAGTTTPFFGGTTLECSDANGFLDQGGNASCVGQTSVVGSYAANPWGLRDVHGNVWEWCLDAYGAYPSGAVTDPYADVGPTRIVRGGSWGNDAVSCRSAVRGVLDPSTRKNTVGFRVVLGPALIGH